MSTIAPNPFGPYATPEELAKGKRKAMLSLFVAVVAVAGFVVAARTVADGRLMTVYLVAAALHFAASVSASVRWSRTPDFGRDG
jgi:hypothetical protein